MAVFKDGSKASSDRSQWDRKRHRELVEEAIKKDLGGIVAEESIIGQSGNKKIKIPIKGIKEYQFIYGKNTPGTGSGTGGEARGQSIGKTKEGQGEKIPGPAGSDAGEDIFETEITLDELANYLFEDLQLPDLERKKFSQLETRHKHKRSGFQKKGIPPRLAKKRTLIEKIKRQQTSLREADVAAGEEERPRIPFREEDLKYHRIKEDVDYHSNAVVLCIMDTSGSMDQTRKYLARSFYFLLYQFVRYKYEQVEVVFISHSTEAKEVTEAEFFHKGESGGTFISSGYSKALEIIEQRYNPSIWNIYAFHCSDGDNWSEDNEKAITLASKLCEICNLFGYGNVGAPQWGSTIQDDFAKKVKAPNFVMTSMLTKDDIWPSFKKILEKEQAGGEDYE
ncbi:MAG: sporulation protein YhbH [Sporomusaceae bacterium]|nr:sporulation protein YhbH [Sporomusaceae bacterium]